MKKMKNMGICLALMACLTGCALLNDGNQEPQGEHYLFGFTGMDLTDPSYRAALVELQSTAEKNGDSVISFDPDLDNDKQLEGIHQMLEQGIDVLFLGPVDADGIQPALEECQEAGVPVICFDSKVTDAEYITSFVGGDNYQLGELIGQEMIRDFPDGGKLGLLTNPLANSVKERERGIRDALEGSNVEVAVCQDITRYEEVLPKAEELLREYPEVDILWGLNDDVTLLLHSSVLAVGREDEIALYGTGSYYGSGGDILLEAIRKGFVRAASLQEPSQWGVLCAALGYQLLSGQEIEEEYLGNSLVINQGNVGDYESE